MCILVEREREKKSQFQFSIQLILPCDSSLIHIYAYIYGWELICVYWTLASSFNRLYSLKIVSEIMWHRLLSRDRIMCVCVWMCDICVYSIDRFKLILQLHALFGGADGLYVCVCVCDSKYQRYSNFGINFIFVVMVRYFMSLLPLSHGELYNSKL